MTEHPTGLLTPFQESASDTPTRLPPRLSCRKARPAISFAPANCRKVQHWTQDLRSRLAEHEAGRGARLLEVIRDAGLGWKLARTWPGDRKRERQIKDQGGASRHCPECGVRPRNGLCHEEEAPGPAESARVPETSAALARPERLPAFERGAAQARRAVRQQIDAGFSADRIAEVQGRIFAAVIPERAGAEGREVARGYRETAEALIAAHREASTPQPATATEVTQPKEGTEMSTGTAAGQAAGDRERTEAAARTGAITAQQIIVAQANAGMTADRIAEHHQDVAASLLNGAETREGEAFAIEYSLAGEALVGDLREMDRGPEPDHTPGSPHPDPRLAARGWRNCEHGIYHRRQAQAEADSDPEAA